MIIETLREVIPSYQTSLVKHVNGWDLVKKGKSNYKVDVKHFSRANTDYMILITQNPDHYVGKSGLK